MQETHLVDVLKTRSFSDAHHVDQVNSISAFQQQLQQIQ